MAVLLMLSTCNRSVGRVRRTCKHNGHEFLLKLHSFDGIHGQIDWPRGSADRYFGATFRIDLSADGARNKRACTADHRDGVALFPRRFSARLSHPPIQGTRYYASSDSPANDDRRMWPGADYISQSARARIHLGWATRVSFLYVPGVGRIAGGGA